MKQIIIGALGIILLMRCGDKDKHGNMLDTPTSGAITITVDESLKPLIDAEISAFEGIYHNAKVHVVYTSESEAITRLLNDSARLSIITRKLRENEKANLLRQAIVPSQLKLATGGIALICNPAFNDSLLSIAKLKALLSGDKNSMSVTPEAVVFDQPNSGITRFLTDTLKLVGPLPNYCFAVNGNAEVVDYVSKNRKAIGLIDISWISDRDDSTANEFLKTIKVLALANDSAFYRPYQAYMAQGQYPLLRDVMIVSREARTGLASGFMAFMASDKGQRIVLKSGLVPATMPIRIIEVNHEPF
ncbi:substrate-binding domain-containing protein [Chryseolinea sp. H1M3-3]|uniref:PstS family phosphate ABC transporter substrate-binding protein n=1 Tax=Chryseolinea sp. H1M3-3 TaxID=3034144 RepID=UPI0023ED71ED|nr:substrate-binding domain-containing protein [Chryseolinea sp. H1M3-3]